MPTFEVINGEEAQAIKAMPKGRSPGRQRDPGSMAGRLRAGEVIWLPGGRTAASGGIGDLMRKHGFRIHRRAAERDGVKGLYVWAEPIEQVAS